ncbi:hypothetical protein Tco_0236656 [Tanacetum coccineum]
MMVMSADNGYASAEDAVRHWSNSGRERKKGSYATIKMDVDETFTLTNIGKSSVSMNGNLVVPEQVAALGSSSLIELSSRGSTSVASMYQTLSSGSKLSSCSSTCCGPDVCDIRTSYVSRQCTSSDGDNAAPCLPRGLAILDWLVLAS